MSTPGPVLLSGPKIYGSGASSAATANVASNKSDPKDTPLFKTRNIIAALALKKVKEELPLGAPNTLQRETLYRKVNELLYSFPNSPLGKFERSQGTLTQLTAKKLINDTIALLKEYSIEGLLESDFPHLKTIFSSILLGLLFPDDYSALFNEGTTHSFSKIFRFNRIARLLKTETCKVQSFLALEYVMRQHSTRKEIYPIQVINLFVPGVKLASNGHSVLCFGKLKEVDTMFVDPWSEQNYRESKLRNHLPFDLQAASSKHKRLSVEPSICIACEKDVKTLLESVEAKVYTEDLGVSPEEIEVWLQSFYAIFTQPKSQSKTCLALPNVSQPSAGLSAHQSISAQQSASALTSNANTSKASGDGKSFTP